MIRDPLYRQIRDRLEELDDGNAFEACANDLLRKIYPSLAPREGGNDAGLDGLIAGEKRSSVQLICTTGKDVLINLSSSIESNLKKSGKSHACILATSQRLTNQKKRTLEQRAQELGRPLIQIYDQAGMAQLLYRDPRWLKELLGLLGNPPSLSLFPITNRPLIEVPPIGRDEDLSTITRLTNDIVLIGQPGSGKTHLLFTAAKKTKGRFVVDEDLGRVADGVRSIQPNFLIIDDAHSRLELIKKIRHLRQEIGADFRILASCWPGQEDAICAALQSAMSHTLDSLPQKQIKEVIQSQKIFGPDHLVAEIIHQAQGKPGLAVTLCRLCWESGNTRDVVLGKALARDVKLSFEPLLGQEATHLLACFSIGGSAGLTLESTARLLNKNVFEIKRSAERLAAAGVLDFSESRISVHPIRLRQALVRDVFLQTPPIELAPYLAEAADFAATTRVLIEAKLMGGSLSDELLRSRLKQLSTTYEQPAFEEYARLGRRETEWILDTFPEKLETVAQVALHTSPNKTLKMLLDVASSNFDNQSPRRGRTRTEDVMPEIKRWILSANPGGDEASERRSSLAMMLEKWFIEKKDRTIAVQAAALVLSLKYESTSSPPGEPMTITMSFGTVSRDQIPKIAALWPRVLPILSEALPSQGSDIANVFHDWVHPNHPGKGAPQDYERVSREYAYKMMSDLLEAFTGKWTFHYHLHNYSKKLGLGAHVKIAPVAGILYPPRDILNWEQEQKRQIAAADELAAELNEKEPNMVAGLLTAIEKQATEANINSHPPICNYICGKIANGSKNLEIWISALFELGGAAQLLEPFLEKLAATKPYEAERWVLLALEKPALQFMGNYLTLRYYNPDNQIWSKASPLFKNITGLIEGCVIRKELPTKNLKSLLNHEDPEVAGAAATGLWGYRDEVEIPGEVFADWKRVIVESVDDGQEHILEKIFPKYPDIAYEWIAWRVRGIADETRPFWFGDRHDRSLPAAVNALSPDQKRDLINRMPCLSNVAELARLIVGRDLDLFAHLLSREELGNFRLNPLRLDFGSFLHSENKVFEFDEGWQKMAAAAMDKGFSEEEVFSYTQPQSFGWSGSTSSMYAARLAPFEKLLQHPDPRLCKIAKIGVENFSRLRDQHLALEKRAAIRGELA